MKIVKKKTTENCNFYRDEKSLYIAWACFRNEGKFLPGNSMSYKKHLFLKKHIR